jgi:ElaB/YqjD/DUF883 family membrane-anchored ribosome-binding protein
VGNQAPETALVAKDYSAELESIQANIQAARQRIEENLRGLEDEVAHRVDVKAWIRKNPEKAIGFAFALGVYFGLK